MPQRLKSSVTSDQAEFIAAAVSLGHPRFLLARVNQESLEAVILGENSLLEEDASTCKGVQPDEDALHESLPAHLKQVLKGKRILLWKEVLLELRYPDAKVMDRSSLDSP